MEPLEQSDDHGLRHVRDDRERALEVAAHRRVANRFLAHVAGLQKQRA